MKSDAAADPITSYNTILDVAERLMTTVGYDKASISLICRESKLTVGSLYHHFGSKAGLLTAVIKRVQQRFFAGLPQIDADSADPDQSLADFWNTAIEQIIANLPYFSLDVELVRLSHDDPELEDILRAQTASSQELISRGLMPFAKIAAAPEPEALTRDVAETIVTFCRGAILVAGTDQTLLRREMESFYPLVHDTIVATGHPQGATRFDALG